MRLAATLIIVLSSTALAGDLTPPAGLPSSTMKTLVEVEPRTAINATNTPGDADSTFKITQPGSYYLTANITGEVGKHGIEIAASGVTIDLNGFELIGVPGMGAFDGIRNTLVLAVNIAITNGSIRSWGANGINLGTTAVNNCRIEAIMAHNNSAAGISTGVGGTVTNCTTYLNLGNGFAAAGNCVFTNCIANRNTNNGITAGSGSIVIHCASYLNSAIGIVVATGSQVIDCTATSNSTNGILFGSNSVIRGNICYLNGNGASIGSNIRTIASGSRIEGNTCVGADTGIEIVAAGNVIVRNICRSNTTNWTISANNVVGPILDRTAPASAAISGNSAPSSLGSTDPNANYTY